MAKPEAQRTIEIPDDSLRTMLFAASIAYQGADFDDALIVYEGVSAARPAWSRPVVGIATALYQLGRTEEAEAAYRRAIDLDDADQEAHLYLAELVWNERHDRDSAEAHLCRAFEIQPKNALGERARVILSRIRRARAA